MTPLAQQAIAALFHPDASSTSRIARDGPGLYAIYGSPEAWQTLGLSPSEVAAFQRAWAAGDPLVRAGEFDVDQLTK